MFAPISAFFVLAFFYVPLVALALPTGGGESQCNTGPIQCCNSLQSANDPATAVLLGLVGVAAGSVTGLVGVTCSPITVIGAGSGCQANQQSVCCQNNSFNGVVAIGCTPINVSV